MKTPNQHLMSVSGDASGIHAFRHVPDPVDFTIDGQEQFLIAAEYLTEVDAHTGVAIRASMEQALVTDQGAEACLWLPKESVARRRLRTLLDPLPTRCSLTDDQTAVFTPDPRVILPVQPAETSDAVGMIASGIYAHANAARRGRLRLGRSDSYLLGQAAAIFLENSLSHASDCSMAPLIACTMDLNSRRTVLSVFDLGSSGSHSADPLATVRQAIAAAQSDRTEVAALLAEAQQRQAAVTLAIRSGTALARWDGTWVTRSAAFSPGWAVSFSLTPTK